MAERLSVAASEQRHPLTPEETFSEAWKMRQKIRLTMTRRIPARFDRETFLDEAVQTTMVNVFRHSGSFDGKSTLYTWVTRIAHNVVSDMLRSRWADPGFIVSVEDAPNDIEKDKLRTNYVDWVTPERLAIARDEVERFLGGMSRADLKLAYETWVLGLPYAQIASSRKWKLGTTKSRIRRLKERGLSQLPTDQRVA